MEKNARAKKTDEEEGVEITVSATEKKEGGNGGKRERLRIPKRCSDESSMKPTTLQEGDTSVLTEHIYAWKTGISAGHCGAINSDMLRAATDAIEPTTGAANPWQSFNRFPSPTAIRNGSASTS